MGQVGSRDFTSLEVPTGCPIKSDPCGKSLISLQRIVIEPFKVNFLARSKRIFFTDENNFYLNPSVSQQNNSVWASGHKSDADPSQLIVEKEKFAPHLMVSSFYQLESALLIMVGYILWTRKQRLMLTAT